jgi:hypothetical protein
MRILAVILGTFIALFGLAFGGCAISVAAAEIWRGMPNPGVFPLLLVSFSLAVVLLRAAYRLFRGPSPPRTSDEDARIQ